MSQVADVILTMSLMEDNGTECPALVFINVWLAIMDYGELKRVDSLAGGGKAMQAAVFLGAFNYLRIHSFTQIVNSAPWKYRAGMALFIKGEDGRFYDMTPTLDKDE